MKSNLYKRGFVSLIATQFWGAANDNILKQVLTFMVASGGLWANKLGAGGQGIVALCLTVPFIVFSGFAGQVADRCSKQRVMFWVKVAEIPIVLIAFLGFYFKDVWLGLLAMLLLATQSTFFGPAKYGVIPELVEDRELSRANGLLNMLTHIAVIMGIVLAGPVSDLYYPKIPGIESGGVESVQRNGKTFAALLGLPADHAPMLWLPGVVMLVVALLGLLSVVLMPKLQPCDAQLKYNFNPFATYIAALKEMAQGPLLAVAFAWSFFYMIAIIALLILPEYAGLLKIGYTENIGLFGSLAISIAIGNALCGFLSGDKIRPQFIVLGAVGMTIMFAFLGIMKPTYWGTLIMLIPAGIAAGFYMVPLQALLQKLSPDFERGRFLGTANALSFVFMSVGAVVYMGAVKIFAMPQNRVFLICAGLSIIGTVAAFVHLGRVLKDRSTESL